jgi:hypothetical protein
MRGLARDSVQRGEGISECCTCEFVCVCIQVLFVLVDDGEPWERDSPATDVRRAASPGGPTKGLDTLGMGAAYCETSVSDSQCSARDRKACCRGQRRAESRRGRAEVTRRKRVGECLLFQSRRDLVASAGVAMRSIRSCSNARRVRGMREGGESWRRRVKGSDSERVTTDIDREIER